MLIGIVLGIFLLIIAVVVFVLVRQKQLAPEKVDVLSMKTIIAHFKTPSVMATLKAKKEYIAVAIREAAAGGRQYCTACIFNEKTEEIVAPIKKWDAAKFDQDLTDAFGDKPLIVLQ